MRSVVDAHFSALEKSDALDGMDAFYQRAYAMIKQTGPVRNLPPWRVADHVGPQGTQIILINGSPDLSVGVPGFYTYEGFHNAFLPALAEVAPSVTALANAAMSTQKRNPSCRNADMMTPRQANELNLGQTGAQSGV